MYMINLTCTNDTTLTYPVIYLPMLDFIANCRNWKKKLNKNAVSGSCNSTKLATSKTWPTAAWQQFHGQSVQYQRGGRGVWLQLNALYANAKQLRSK